MYTVRHRRSQGGAKGVLSSPPKLFRQYSYLVLGETFF